MSAIKNTTNETAAADVDDNGDLQPGPYPSYSMGPMEILLVVLLFLIWFYALRRFYTVWSNVLNFSALGADVTQRAQGWDAFIQWAKEHFRSFRHVESGGVNNNLDRANTVDEEQGQGAKITAFAACRQVSTNSTIELRPSKTTSATKVKTVFVDSVHDHEHHQQQQQRHDEILTSQV